MNCSLFIRLIVNKDDEYENLYITKIHYVPQDQSNDELLANSFIKYLIEIRDRGSFHSEWKLYSMCSISLQILCVICHFSLKKKKKHISLLCC